MIKNIFLLAGITTIATSIFAQTNCFKVNGRVIDQKGTGIKNVVVNDGIHFTKTDSNGAWSLDVDTTFSKFVSISTPAEYDLPQRGNIAFFYKTAKEAIKNSNNDFVLTKRKKPLNRFSYIAISDPQVRDENEMGRWRDETVADMHHVVDSLKKTREVIGMTLGDLVFDQMQLYNEYANTCKAIGCTMFQTIGNHDFDKRYQDLHNMQLNSPVYAEHFYNHYFGPVDYSFNIGNIHVITMKNINYVGKRKYITAVTGQQLEWLKNDLSFVPKGSTVFINMHAAGWNKVHKEGNFIGADDVEKLLEGYSVHFFCGHTHSFQNQEASPTFYQHNIGAACGSWWAGNYSVCGAPNGYLVVDVDGNNVKWHYKPTKGSFSEQFRMYLPGEFRSQPTTVVANVWDYDAKCKVEYYEDGKYKGEMEQFTDFDDAYVVQQIALGKKVSAETGHLFRVKPTNGTKKVKIVFTNRFSEKYSQERML